MVASDIRIRVYDIVIDKVITLRTLDPKGLYNYITRQGEQIDTPKDVIESS